MNDLNFESSTDNLNPYQPTAVAVEPKQERSAPSTWRRNFASLAVIVFGSCLVSILFTGLGFTLPAICDGLLIAIAIFAAMWSNHLVARRIGLQQGGVAVMCILISGWTTVYVAMAVIGVGFVDAMMRSILLR